MQEPTSRSSWDEKILNYVFEIVFFYKWPTTDTEIRKKEEDENTAADGTENPPTCSQ